MAWRWQEEGWGDYWIYNPEPGWLAEQNNIVKQPLFTAPPADAGMREALEFYANEWLGSEGEGGKIEYEPTDRLISDHGDRADAALTAPGATTVPTLVDDPNSASGKRVEYQRPSEPSSTRSEVSVEELARYLDPLVFDNNPVVRHRYCSPLRVDVCQSRLIDKARALLDQFEIRRK